MFYLLFGIFLGSRYGGASAARHLLANFTVFGVMAPGLFGVGMTLAMDRDRGLLELKRALPMPPGIYLAAKLTMSMVFAGIVSILVMVLAAVPGQVVLPLIQWEPFRFALVPKSVKRATAHRRWAYLPFPRQLADLRSTGHRPWTE